MEEVRKGWRKLPYQSKNHKIKRIFLPNIIIRLTVRAYNKNGAGESYTQNFGREI